VIGEEWTQRGIGAILVAGATALVGFVKWLAGRRSEEKRSDAETDAIRADVMRKQAEADDLRRVAVNGTYRNALETASSIVAQVKAEMDRLRSDLDEMREERDAYRQERDDAKDELRACRREAHALRADMEALRKELELVRRQAEQDRRESDERIASFEGRLREGGRERA
jgi:uncharacterized coiled-coil DUF342 family protein